MKNKYTVLYSNRFWYVLNNETNKTCKKFDGFFNDPTAKRKADDWARELNRCNP